MMVFSNSISYVHKKSLNLDLDILWKDFEMKLGEIIGDYKTLLFSNFQKKRICFVRVMSFWKLYARSNFLVASPLFEIFWIYNFEIL
jgi:hypothetical protein